MKIRKKQGKNFELSPISIIFAMSFHSFITND